MSRSDFPEFDPQASREVPDRHVDFHLQLEQEAKLKQEFVAKREDWIPAPEANQENFDRRSRLRKKPPKTSYRIQVQRQLNSLVYVIHGSRGFQILLAVLTMTALGAIWYSATERVQLIHEAQANLASQGRLETQILQINREWSAERIEAIKQGIASADQRRVFADYQSLANWLKDKDSYATQVNLDFTYRLGEGLTANIDNTLEVPISISLSPSRESETAYFDMMDFTRHIVSTAWYVDVQEATLESDGMGAGKMTAEISVWVHGWVKSDG